MSLRSRSRERRRSAQAHNAPRLHAFRYMRSTVVASASALAILVCAAYVPFAASEQASAWVDSVTYTNGKRAVVYGSVKRGSHGVAGAEVQVVARNGHVAAGTRTGRLGTYRVSLRVERAFYRIVLSKSPGSRLRASIKYRLVPGIHLRVSARLTRRGFAFLPLFHY
jgi:hypothetical protein